MAASLLSVNKWARNGIWPMREQRDNTAVPTSTHRRVGAVQHAGLVRHGNARLFAPQAPSHDLGLREFPIIDDTVELVEVFLCVSGDVESKQFADLVVIQRVNRRLLLVQQRENLRELGGVSAEAAKVTLPHALDPQNGIRRGIDGIDRP